MVQTRVRSLGTYALLALAAACSDGSRRHSGVAPNLRVDAEVAAAVEGTAASEPAAVTVTPTGDLIVDTSAGEEVSVALEVAEPGESLNLRLLNPPPGGAFRPLLHVPSPLRADLRWAIPEDLLGLQHLVFEAWTDAAPEATRRFTVSFRLIPGASGQD